MDSHGQKKVKFTLLPFTVWKIRDFSVNQILREINYGEIGSSKNVVFAISGTLQKVQKFMKITNCVKMAVFEPLD